MSARDTALSALVQCRRQSSWSDNALRSLCVRDGLDTRDTALAFRLCYGVQQNRMLLDYDLQQCLNSPFSRLQPVVADILRLAAYQILLLDKIPDSAAVNAAVEQGKRLANVRAAGLINAVLRTLARKKKTLLPPPDLATKYSHSAALVALLRDNLGDGALEAYLAADNDTPKTCVQVNTLVTSVDALRVSLANAEMHPWLPNCFLISGDPASYPAFSDGAFYVQDAAAHVAVLVADPQPNMKVLDCCAAPGGKSFAASIAMNNQGAVLSCDLHENKLYRINEGAQRLGISILSTLCHDARVFLPEWTSSFDVVIADVPCSGLGVIRKKPDIRDKNLAETAALPELQLSILDTVSRYVKPGGVLLYSTCTVLKRENEGVVSSFLTNHADYTAEDFSLFGAITSENGYLTLLPHIHGTDGFFICKLRKNK